MIWCVSTLVPFVFLGVMLWGANKWMTVDLSELSDIQLVQRKKHIRLLTFLIFIVWLLTCYVLPFVKLYTER